MCVPASAMPPRKPTPHTLARFAKRLKTRPGPGKATKICGLCSSPRARNTMRWVLALIFALLAGAGSLYGLTDGFSALTAESARRHDVARQPRAIGDALVTSANDGASSLREELQADGRVAVVNFFYTRCISLCLAQGFVTQRLQAAIEA